MIGAWREELQSQKLFTAERPASRKFDELLYEQGHRHEAVLLEQLEAEQWQVKGLEGGVTEADYSRTLTALRAGYDYIDQASLRHDELRGSADLLQRIEHPSALGAWSYIPIECKLSSHSKPIDRLQACATASGRNCKPPAAAAAEAAASPMGSSSIGYAG